MTIRREKEKKNKIIEIRLINLIEVIDRPIRITKPIQETIKLNTNKTELFQYFALEKAIDYPNGLKELCPGSAATDCAAVFANSLFVPSMKDSNVYCLLMFGVLCLFG